MLSLLAGVLYLGVATYKDAGTLKKGHEDINRRLDKQEDKLDNRYDKLSDGLKELEGKLDKKFDKLSNRLDKQSWLQLSMMAVVIYVAARR